MPDLWNAHDGVRGVFLGACKTLQYQIIQLQSCINRAFQIHMLARLLSSHFLGKCGVFCHQLDSFIEAFFLHPVTTAYGESAPSSGKSECCTLVLKIVIVICSDLRKVHIESYI